MKSYQLFDLPEMARFQAANPGKELDEIQVAMMYCKAVHWLSILDIVWPNFNQMDYYSIEIAYIFQNDPDKSRYPPELYEQLAQIIAMFWQIQLKNNFPKDSWTVQIIDNPELTIAAERVG